MAKSKSRKSRPHPRPATPIAVAPGVARAAPPQTWAFAELQKRAAELREAQDFAGMLELGRLSPEAISAAPTDNVLAWLALQEVRGLAGDESLDAYDRVKRSNQEELVVALGRLSNHDPEFPALAEFDLYVRTLGYDLVDALEGMRWLSAACRAQPHRLDLLENLRGRVLRIMLRDEYREDDETWTPEIEALAEAAGEVDLVLRDALERAWASPRLAEEDRLLVTVLRADLDMRVAQPWEPETALAWVSRLPRTVDLLDEEREYGYSREVLTPESWAFLWEFQNTPLADLPAVFAKYPASLGLRCDGLRMIAESILSQHQSEQETVFFGGLCRLAPVANLEDGMFGQALTVQGLSGPKVLPLGWNALFAPSLRDCLVRLLEHAPRFIFKSELAVALEG
jgi:hypothetical protein